MHKIIRDYQGRAVAVLLGLAALSMSAHVSAWTLDPACSRLIFSTSKTLNNTQNNAATSIVEMGYFSKLRSSFSDDSRDISLLVDLDSVETAIPIRNERIRRLLFNTEAMPVAKLGLRLEQSVGELLRSQALQLDLPANFELHGVSVPIQLHLDVARSSTHLLINSQPVLVRASAFNLLEGIESLRQVAGLLSIAAEVPVQARLCYLP